MPDNVSTDFVSGTSSAHLPSFANVTKTDEVLAAFEKALRGVGIRMFFGKFQFLSRGDGTAKEACMGVHEVVDGLINDGLRYRKDNIAERSKNMH